MRAGRAPRPRVLMNGVKDKSWFLRGGLFAKYVISLVGLVVFVLAVNGVMETWISYRATRASLTDGMAEKAEATSRRIEQAMSDLERQTSWVTRASANAFTVEQRRADYGQLMNQVPAVSQVSFINAQGREELRLSRSGGVSYGSTVDFSRDMRFTETLSRGATSFSQAYFRDGRPFISLTMAHTGYSGAGIGITIVEIDLGFLSDYLGDAQVSRNAIAYVVDSQGLVLATSNIGPDIAKDLSALPQVSASLAGSRETAGKDWNGHDVLTASSIVPKFKWAVFFEQLTAQALTPIRDQLLRIALLIGLGLIVAILAGTVLARRMLIPINALSSGARRLGEGEFGHRIEVKTSDELEQLAGQFNSMASQLQETYTDLEWKVKERTRDLAQSINELKVLEEVGRAVASSLDLNAVLPTVAARALEITHADAVLIYAYDAANDCFNLTEAIGINKNAEAARRAIDRAGSTLGDAAGAGEPIAIPNLHKVSDIPLRDVAIAAGFYSVLVLAMRNARLFSEVNQKSHELEVAHSTVQQQAATLQEQRDQLKDWNKSLEDRVETQLGEIERIRKLERFLSPQVAQLIASSDGHEGLLDSHRREVTVLFCDLRGFTAFTEQTEPEEAMNVLREYHAALGELIFRYEGTLDRYAGDGVMILFNAPIQFEDHVKRAVKMSVEMRDTIGALTQRWRNRGHNLGFGMGIALGYATLGQIGFEQRLEYAAIGSVTNLASRLCDEAEAGQIVVSRRVYGMVEQWVEGKPIDDLNLKGFNHPVPATEILGWREEVDNVVDASAATAKRRMK